MIIKNNEKLLKIMYENYNKNYRNPVSFEEFKERTDLKYRIGDIPLNILETSTGKWDYDCWIGGNPNNMRDDQTLGDYKKEIIKALSEIGIEVDTLEYIEEGWYDG